MPTELQFRRYTFNNSDGNGEIDSFTGELGEIFIHMDNEFRESLSTDKWSLRIQDGLTPGGIVLSNWFGDLAGEISDNTVLNTAFDSKLNVTNFNQHVSGIASRHTADNIDFDGSAVVPVTTANNVNTALIELYEIKADVVSSVRTVAPDANLQSINGGTDTVLNIGDQSTINALTVLNLGATDYTDTDNAIAILRMYNESGESYRFQSYAKTQEGSGNEPFALVHSTGVTDTNVFFINTNNDFVVEKNLRVNGNIFLGDNELTDTITIVADFTSDLVPQTDSTYDLGATDKAWNTLYVNSIQNDEPYSTGVIVENITIENTSLLSQDGIKFDNTGYIKLPVGDISSRPVAPENGMIRFNSNNNSFEGYNGTQWSSFDAGGSGADGYIGDTQTHIAGGDLDMTDNLIKASAPAGGGIAVSGTITPDATGNYYVSGTLNGENHYFNGTYYVWFNGGTWSIDNATSPAGGDGTASWLGDGTIDGTYTNFTGATGTATVALLPAGSSSTLNLAAGTYNGLSIVSQGVITNLSITNINATTLDIASSDGADATVPAASQTEAGLLTAIDKTKLDGIVSNVTTDLTIANRQATTLDVASSDGTDATLPQAEAGALADFTADGNWSPLSNASFIDSGLTVNSFPYYIAAGAFAGFDAYLFNNNNGGWEVSDTLNDFNSATFYAFYEAFGGPPNGVYSNAKGFLQTGEILATGEGFAGLMSGSDKLKLDGINRSEIIDTDGDAVLSVEQNDVDTDTLVFSTGSGLPISDGTWLIDGVPFPLEFEQIADHNGQPQYQTTNGPFGGWLVLYLYYSSEPSLLGDRYVLSTQQFYPATMSYAFNDTPGLSIEGTYSGDGNSFELNAGSLIVDGSESLSLNETTGNINVSGTLTLQGGTDVQINSSDTTINSSLLVNSNDLEVSHATTPGVNGIILESPDATRWKITIDNNGNLTTTVLP